MEFIQNRFGLRLAYSLPFVRAQFGNLTLIVRVQVEEFAARMRLAAGFGHALGNQRLVARVIIAAGRSTKRRSRRMLGPAIRP